MNIAEVVRQLLLLVFLVGGFDIGIAFIVRAQREATPDDVDR